MSLVNITLPVLNEEEQLRWSVTKLHAFLLKHCRFDFEIVIADNGSTDRTGEIAEELGCEVPCVRSIHLAQKGRGRALREAWSDSLADVLSYMDIDLSTDLYAFPPMIEALLTGGFSIATGSRLLKPVLTTRSWNREIISRAYNVLIKGFFGTRFSDAQCGFKAITRTAASALLPLVDDNGWFFDTELLVLGERLGYQIFDLPARWIEDPDSRVNIARTAADDIRGLLRLRRNFSEGKYTQATVTSHERDGVTSRPSFGVPLR